MFFSEYWIYFKFGKARFLWYVSWSAGADPGGAPGGPPPLKLKKKYVFSLRKIVIFHTKYLKNFRASLRQARFFFKCAPPLTWNPGSAPGLHYKWIKWNRHKFDQSPFIEYQHLKYVHGIRVYCIIKKIVVLPLTTSCINNVRPRQGCTNINTS